MRNDRRDATVRFLDLAAVLATAILWVPISLAIAITIRLVDGSPVLFRQTRVGRHGDQFTLLKFRTMTATPSQRFGPPDPQDVTPIGSLLRRTSLDEIPQLLNVLRGEMSLVGPRPVRPEHLQRSERFGGARLDVLPGLTGLAQVSGRNELSWNEKIDLDLEYVRRRSFRLNTSILVATVRRVTRGDAIDHPPGDDPLGTQRSNVKSDSSAHAAATENE